MWFNLSHAAGDKKAQSSLAFIERRVTSEQIAAAQTLAREWHDQHGQKAEEDW